MIKFIEHHLKMLDEDDIDSNRPLRMENALNLNLGDLVIENQNVKLVQEQNTLENIKNKKVNQNKGENNLNRKQLAFQENKMRVVTIKDIQQLPFELRFKYDQRNIFKYAWDSVRADNKLFYIFFKSSLLNPYYIRILSTFAVMSWIFTMNAILYKDADIKKRYEMDTNHKVLRNLNVIRLTSLLN